MCECVSVYYDVLVDFNSDPINQLFCMKLCVCVCVYVCVC